MTAAVLLAAVAAACAVPAAWLAVGALDDAQLARATRRWLEPALTAARDGREPTCPERRRLAALGIGGLLAAGWLAAGSWAGLALCAAGPWATRVLVGARRRARNDRLAAGAPLVARALADALSGGHSLRGAVVEVAHAGAVPGPAAELLRGAAVALELGQDTDDVLRTLALDAGGGPYDALVGVALLQRTAGGDLAAALRGVALALEERGRAVADARSATAQARFTAWLVAALPLGGGALVALASPGTITGLVTTGPAALLVGVALALQAAALLIVRRIARVDALR